MTDFKDDDFGMSGMSELPEKEQNKSCVNFSSKFDIDDDVYFLPSAKDLRKECIAAEYRDGTIVKVSFTAAKVFYDILCPYYGKVFTNVDSVRVNASQEDLIEENKKLIDEQQAAIKNL